MDRMNKANASPSSLFCQKEILGQGTGSLSSEAGLPSVCWQHGCEDGFISGNNDLKIRNTGLSPPAAALQFPSHF